MVFYHCALVEDNNSDKNLVKEVKKNSHIVEKKLKRVVIDTNSLVAARFRRDGSSAALMDLCIDGSVRALITPEIETENRSILKKVKPSNGYWDKLQRFYDSAEVITDLPALNISEDPGDNKYLECALGGNADCLISSDKHLLEHNGYQGLKICKSHEFLLDNPSLRKHSSATKTQRVQ